MPNCLWTEAVYIQRDLITAEEWNNRTPTAKKTYFGIKQLHAGGQAKDQVGTQLSSHTAFGFVAYIRGFFVFVCFSTSTLLQVFNLGLYLKLCSFNMHTQNCGLGSSDATSAISI